MGNNSFRKKHDEEKLNSINTKDIMEFKKKKK